jgi:hypothetical protein
MSLETIASRRAAKGDNMMTNSLPRAGCRVSLGAKKKRNNGASLAIYVLGTRVPKTEIRNNRRMNHA